MLETNNFAPQSASEPFVITRTVKAPRALVWKLHTEREHLMRWFGPKGFTMQSCSMDLRPGGLFHYCLRSPDGMEMWAKWIFREIDEPNSLNFIVSFSDPQGGTTIHPMNPNWPREILSTIRFTEQNGQTTIDVEWSPYNATELEQKTFDDGRESMTIGWSGTFERLDSYLSTL